MQQTRLGLLGPRSSSPEIHPALPCDLPAFRSEGGGKERRPGAEAAFGRAARAPVAFPHLAPGGIPPAPGLASTRAKIQRERPGTRRDGTGRRKSLQRAATGAPERSRGRKAAPGKAPGPACRRRRSGAGRVAPRRGRLALPYRCPGGLRRLSGSTEKAGVGGERCPKFVSLGKPQPGQAHKPGRRSAGAEPCWRGGVGWWSTQEVTLWVLSCQCATQRVTDSPGNADLTPLRMAPFS